MRVYNIGKHTVGKVRELLTQFVRADGDICPYVRAPIYG